MTATDPRPLSRSFEIEVDDLDYGTIVVRGRRPRAAEALFIKKLLYQHLRHSMPETEVVEDGGSAERMFSAMSRVDEAAAAPVCRDLCAAVARYIDDVCIEGADGELVPVPLEFAGTARTWAEIPASERGPVVEEYSDVLLLPITSHLTIGARGDRLGKSRTRSAKARASTPASSSE